MSTIERHNGKVFFEFQGKMISKKGTAQNSPWVVLCGSDFNRTDLSNFVRNKATANRSQVMHLRSILNRFFGYNLPYVI